MDDPAPREERPPDLLRLGPLCDAQDRIQLVLAVKLVDEVFCLAAGRTIRLVGLGDGAVGRRGGGAVQVGMRCGREAALRGETAERKSAGGRRRRRRRLSRGRLGVGRGRGAASSRRRGRRVAPKHVRRGCRTSEGQRPCWRSPALAQSREERRAGGEIWVRERTCREGVRTRRRCDALCIAQQHHPSLFSAFCAHSLAVLWGGVERPTRNTSPPGDGDGTGERAGARAVRVRL